MRFPKNDVAARAAACVAVLMLLISPGLGRGQETARGQSGSGHPGADGSVNPDSISDATLKHTARAYLKVAQIVKSGLQSIDSASGDAQKLQIAKRIESSKLAAVKGEGLEPRQYNQVLQLARADKAFQQRFLSYVKAEQGSSGNAE